MKQDYFTINELAKEFRVTQVTVYRLFKNNDLPYNRVGRKRIILREDFAKWMKGNYRGPDLEEMRKQYLIKEEKRIQEKKILIEDAIKKEKQRKERSKLHNRIAGLIRYSLKGNKKGRHWEDLVGYGLESLKRRLKKTIPQNYTWDDYLKGELWIDHIIPITAFNIECPESIDFKRCWTLSNLRLLPKIENISKGNKLLKSFQPGLNLKGVVHEGDHRAIS